MQPGAVRVGVLVDPNYAPTQSFVSDVQAGAFSIGKQIEVLEAPTGRDIDRAFASLAQKPVDALVVGPGPWLDNRRVQVVTLATYHRVPAIYPWREAAEIGGLMSYGTRITDACDSLWRRAMMGRLDHDQEQLFYSFCLDEIGRAHV